MLIFEAITSLCILSHHAYVCATPTLVQYQYQAVHDEESSIHACRVQFSGVLGGRTHRTVTEVLLHGLVSVLFVFTLLMCVYYQFFGIKEIMGFDI
jgi:hypothetical protein